MKRTNPNANIIVNGVLVLVVVLLLVLLSLLLLYYSFIL